MFKSLNRYAFEVGGCVRDELMGIAPHDIDYVIEKTTPEQFREVFPCPTGLENCKDCKIKCEAPSVGESFPVYLINGQEVALARTEQKTGEKYQDFRVIAGVSIEEDLARRDFTINSIAKHYETGVIIDPFGGAKDIRSRILRCINPVAFVEDPLRIYRGARFAEKYMLFIEPDTRDLITANVHNLVHVNAERVYAELKKVYESGSSTPGNFFKVLRILDALKIHFKPLHLLTKVPAGPVKYHGLDTAFEHSVDAFSYAKAQGYSFNVALAALFHDTGKGITPKSVLPNHHGHENRSHKINKQFTKQHRFTSKQEDMIVNFGLVHMKFHFIEQMNPTRLVRFWKTIKKYAEEYIQCANCDSPLNEQQNKTLELIKKVFKETKIEVPKGCKDPASFVEQKYASALKPLLKEIRE